MAHSPAFHLQSTMFIQINRVRAHQGGAVIIDNVFIFGSDDSEMRAERKPRPIGGSTAAFAAREMSANRIATSAIFAARIRCGSYVLKSSRIRPPSRMRSRG